jgi:catechol 2,3-dioxygenase
LNVPQPTTGTPYGIAPPEFRLPDQAHVGVVRLGVTDLQRSIDYYDKVIGLRIVGQGSDGVMLGVPGSGRGLIELHEDRRLRPARRGALGLYHFAILLPDRASLGRFTAHLAARGERVGMADHLVSEALYLYDPDRLGIEVYADRPRSAWQHRNGELAMSTDPLDVERLVAAASGREWEGAPEGTTMGHVHLHVGDLGAAESFYHSALGFDKTVWSYPGALFFSAGGYHHHLGTNTWSPGPAARDDEARLIDWELVLPNNPAVEAAARSLERAGHQVNATGGVRTVADPWGTRLRLTT